LKSFTKIIYAFLESPSNLHVQPIVAPILHYTNSGWEFFSSPPCPDRLWGSPSLSNAYRRLLPRN